MKCYDICETEIGLITIICDERAVLSIDFGETKPEALVRKRTELIEKTEKEIKEYFAGSRREFDLPLNPKGTQFQKQVWEALEEIPYGETRSYKDIAIRIGNPNACRAVGMANHHNPIPIVIPCHRVIGAGGSLVGYGGGLEIKTKLLKLERPGEVW